MQLLQQLKQLQIGQFLQDTKKREKNRQCYLWCEFTVCLCFQLWRVKTLEAVVATREGTGWLWGPEGGLLYFYCKSFVHPMLLHLQKRFCIWITSSNNRNRNHNTFFSFVITKILSGLRVWLPCFEQYQNVHIFSWSSLWGFWSCSAMIFYFPLQGFWNPTLSMKWFLAELVNAIDENKQYI